jgi:5'-3' exonuclease
LFGQFPLAERAVHALGITVWSMIEFEADDALAAGAARYGNDPAVQQILLCTPDKDLTQCVRGNRVVSFDRFKDVTLDDKGVREKFGVAPVSIPDLLALTGDTADGVPGLPKWGAKSASTLLAEYIHLDKIPDDEGKWKVKVRGAASLAESLREHRKEALLYRQLTTLREDVPLKESTEDLRWLGARRQELEALCDEIGETTVMERVPKWRDEG